MHSPFCYTELTLINSLMLAICSAIMLTCFDTASTSKQALVITRILMRWHAEADGHHIIVTNKKAPSDYSNRA